MHISSLLIPLLSLSLTANAARFPHGKADRRNAHPAVRGEEARQEPAPVNEARGVSKKAKRLVRKKKRGTACQVPLGNNLTSSSLASTTSTSAIGNNDWAGGPSSSSTTAWSSVTASTTAWSSVTASSTTTASSTATSAAPSSNSDWNLVADWSGNTFFDNFNFWTWNDPTHGTVDFQSPSDAWNSGLISVDSNGHAFMRVDTTQNVQGGRKAIRIHGNLVFTGGMVLMDAYHMPTGCGTWPAWWQNGPNWPLGGEIDILEGVNAFEQNQVSLHTGRGCTMPSNLNNNMLATLTTGNYNSYDCSSDNTANQGCGARDEVDTTSYGTGFNNNKGGVYAMKWDKSGIAVWFFARGKIPSDITNDTPDPSTWGTPVANFPSDDCAPYTYFYDHYNIFDTTFCGDWAGADSVWNYAGYAGQSQSCAAMTGYSTCSDYVLNSGSSFSEAYWEIASVKYFNSTSQV